MEPNLHSLTAPDQVRLYFVLCYSHNDVSKGGGRGLPLESRIKQREDIELQLQNALPREWVRIYKHRAWGDTEGTWL